MQLSVLTILAAAVAVNGLAVPPVEVSIWLLFGIPLLINFQGHRL